MFVLRDCFSPDPLTRGIRLSWDFLLLLLCLLLFLVVSLFSAHVTIYRTRVWGERPRVSYSQRVFLESQGPYPVHVLFFVYQGLLQLLFEFYWEFTNCNQQDKQYGMCLFHFVWSQAQFLFCSFFKALFYNGVQLINNVMIVSGEQQGDPDQIRSDQLLSRVRLFATP